MGRSRTVKTPATIIKPKVVEESESQDVVEEVLFEEPIQQNIIDPFPEELEDEVDVIVEEVKEVEVPVDTKLIQLKKYLVEYTDLHNSTFVTPTIREQLIRKFNLIVRFVLNNTSIPVLDEMYSFFKTNRWGILAEDTVFQSISKMAAGPRMQIETFYTVFITTLDAKKMKKKLPISLEAVREILKNDDLINYLLIKLNK